jgi:hypothetical protein
MSNDAKKPVPRALAMAGALSFSSAALLGFWLVAFLAIAWATGGWVSGLVGLLRASVFAAVAATLVTVVIWRSLHRYASRSVAAALSMISVGVTGTYWLLPDAFVYAEF